MSETTETRQDGQLKQGIAPQTVEGWMRFHQKLVMLQLHIPWYGVVPDAQGRPTVMTGTDGSPLGTPTLPGVLYVETDSAKGVLLVIETDLPGQRAKATIAVPPAAVAFCTMIEKSIIHQA